MMPRNRPLGTEESYEVARVFSRDYEPQAYRDILSNLYEFEENENGILEHASGNADAEVTDNSISVYYDPEVVDEFQDWLWERELKKGLQHIAFHGVSFVDIDGMLEDG